MDRDLRADFVERDRDETTCFGIDYMIYDLRGISMIKRRTMPKSTSTRCPVCDLHNTDRNPPICDY
jgi:hypothetical protein